MIFNNYKEVILNYRTKLEEQGWNPARSGGERWTKKELSSRFARLFAIIVMRGIVTMEGENGQPWLRCKIEWATSLLTLCSNWPGHLREQKPLMDHGARYNRTWHCEEVEEEKKGRHIVVIKFLNTQIVAIGL